MKRWGAWFAASCLAVILSGCESFRVHNPAADAAANSAKTYYDASKVTEALKGEGAMLNGLVAKEVDAYRKTTQAERNFQLLSLINESGSSEPRTTSNGIVSRTNDQITSRLIELLGPVADRLAALRDLDQAKRTLRDVEISERSARDQLITFNAKFSALPACNKDIALLKDKSTADDAAALIKDESFVPKNILTSEQWTGQISNLGATCDLLIKARAALDVTLKKLNSGQVSNAIKALGTLQNAQTTAQNDAQTAALKLKQAATKLAAAQKATKEATESDDLTCDFSKPAKKEKTDVDEKKSDLCSALDKLNGLGDDGIKLLSEERLARINTVLAAMSGIEPATDAPSLEPSLALLSASSRLGQALKRFQMSNTLPALEPLLIERQITAAQLAYAQGGLDLAKARVRFAQDYADASLQEVDLLLKAKAELGALGPLPAPKTACPNKRAIFCASMNQLLTQKEFSDTKLGGGETIGRRTYRALAFLSESYSVARDRQRTAEVMMIDIDYRDSLLRSEASIAAWNALVSVPVDLLAALYKQGWTPLEIAQLIQSFGVIGLAARIK